MQVLGVLRALSRPCVNLVRFGHLLLNAYFRHGEKVEVEIVKFGGPDELDQKRRQPQESNRRIVTLQAGRADSFVCRSSFVAVFLSTKTRLFKLAEKIPGPTTERLVKSRREKKCCILLRFERRGRRLPQHAVVLKLTVRLRQLSQMHIPTSALLRSFISRLGTLASRLTTHNTARSVRWFAGTSGFPKLPA